MKITFEELKTILKNKKKRAIYDSFVVDISTENAQEILRDFNGPNRKVSQSNKNKIKASMMRGLFNPYANANIQFSRFTGLNCDGGNRLTALAELKESKTYPFTVTIGAEPDLSADSGKKRTQVENMKCCGTLAPNVETLIDECKLARSCVGVLCRVSKNDKDVFTKNDFTSKILKEEGSKIVKFFENVPRTGKFNARYVAALLNLYILGVINDKDVNDYLRGIMDDPTFVDYNSQIISFTKNIPNYKGGQAEERELFVYATECFIAAKKKTSSRVNAVTKKDRNSRLAALSVYGRKESVVVKATRKNSKKVA